MNYIGIDIHKKYCVLSALNEAGERTLEARIATNDRGGFEEYLRAVEGPCKAVIGMRPPERLLTPRGGGSDPGA